MYICLWCFSSKQSLHSYCHHTPWWYPYLMGTFLILPDIILIIIFHACVCMCVLWYCYCDTFYPCSSFTFWCMVMIMAPYVVHSLLGNACHHWFCHVTHSHLQNVLQVNWVCLPPKDVSLFAISFLRCSSTAIMAFWCVWSGDDVAHLWYSYFIRSFMEISRSIPHLCSMHQVSLSCCTATFDPIGINRISPWVSEFTWCCLLIRAFMVLFIIVKYSWQSTEVTVVMPHTTSWGLSVLIFAAIKPYIIQ